MEMSAPLYLHVIAVLACSLHILLRRHRQPEARAAWLLLLFALPFAGTAAYLLFGTTNIGRRRIARFHEVTAALPDPAGFSPGVSRERLDGSMELFEIGRSISGYPQTDGNQAELMTDSDTAIQRLVEDIDDATQSVHLLFYIWLDDGNGRKVADALMRAAARGVACRALVDDIGSRALIRAPLWQALVRSGVQMRRALAVGNPLLRPFNGRIDLRDHRKIAVVDNRLAYCGSQNCADPQFLPKARFGPWVDVLLRFEGPVVRQNQHLFASAWMANGGDDIAMLLDAPAAADSAKSGFVAQVIAAGPIYQSGAMPEMFASLIYAARSDLVITTPYYVPTEGLQTALRAAAQRGVDTTIIFPARNDNFAVGAICRGQYEGLLNAGVKVFEFKPGLLHAKTLTVDGSIALIGSANMDRRSFDLNFENNILLYDSGMVAQIRERQASFLGKSDRIELAHVASWGILKRLRDNLLSMLAPIL